MTIYTVTCGRTRHTIRATGAADAIARAMVLFGHGHPISAKAAR
ncbi:hypothetical protein [Delftia lacustris]|nr:hypothetical protein [Delftia lacustris]